MLTREEFVKICKQSILDTREEISISNQLSGYQKFHKELKENNYLDYVRDVMEQENQKNGYSLLAQCEIIKRAEIGCCAELAEYLSAKIMLSLSNNNIDARVRIVSSETTDHVYLHIRIKLKDERDSSLWEVDAWDPRIIDVTLRPDKTIKNSESLKYGYSPIIRKTFFVSDFSRQQTDLRFFNFPKPVPGAPQYDATPPREMLDKHKGLYSDYTLEKAYQKKNLNSEEKLGYLQMKSSWQ